MLEPNTIPQQEPILRVGIVMPADKIQHITVIVPDDGTYTLITAENHSEPLSPRARWSSVTKGSGRFAGKRWSIKEPVRSGESCLRLMSSGLAMDYW